MIRKIASVLIAVPVAVLIVLFAVANRQWVGVSLDPFASDLPALAVTLPFYLVILLALIAGVVVGGVATWFGQARWRRATRRQQAELGHLRIETEILKRRAEAPPPAPARSTPLTPLAYRRPPAA